MRGPFSKFFADRGTHLAAMIAYFALLSFVPLLFLALTLLLVAPSALITVWDVLFLGIVYVLGSAVHLAHLLAGEMLLVVTPFSKLQHVVLFWTSPASTKESPRMTMGAVAMSVSLRKPRES